MAAPVITQSGTVLTFSWTPPNDNGESIDSYQLLLFDRNDDTYREWKSLCNGTDYLADSTPS
jgi:hypothetical protein